MLIVDTHAHLDSPDEVRYPKIPHALRPPPGKGTLAHLRRETRINRIDRVVIVQTGSLYGFDNRLIVDTVHRNRDWTTGVCTMDPFDSDGPALLARYAQTFNIRGQRFGPNPGSTPAFGYEGHWRLWEEGALLGLVSCVLIHKESTDELAKLLVRFPHTPVVLEHCMGLRTGADDILKTVCDLARFPNLYAQLTFVPGDSVEPYPFRDMHETVRRVIDAYGAEPCLWGSAFPCELWCVKVSYGEHLRLFTDEIRMEEAERRAILGGAATRLWFS
ncbi:MAG: amidohydrolase [candidate division Zixibacteria bacterium]|nr:amidohydrolase [candidate division Zixibacteria bacterium]